jgi:hypothetical protein
MRQTYITYILTICLSVIYSDTSHACRIRSISIAQSKSFAKTFAYFDRVAIIRATAVVKSSLVGQPQFLSPTQSFIKFRVIKSYKGDLPEEFYIYKTDSGICGQDFHGDKDFLVFFDSISMPDRLSEDPFLPLLRTSFESYAESKVVRVDNMSIADEVIEDAKRR